MVKKDIASTIIFSFFILILMVLAPMIIIKSVPTQANSEEIPILTDEINNDVLLKGTDVVKVNITKENRIEEISIEEYVKSVVSAEMPVSFSDEALKAQAIAARTYIASKRLENCSDANGADVCDSTHCQVYMNKEDRLSTWGDDGKEYWDKISKAVEDTKGMVLTYNNELVLYPQFFSTSSGRTENSIDVFSSEIPYLVSIESTGEEIAPKFQTEFIFTISEFTDKINEKYPEARLTTKGLESNIEIITRSDAGSIKKIRVGEINLRGLEFRLALGLTSSNFQYYIDGEKVVFNCKGYGHGVGMSQWGANIMAKNGANYQEILKHYYTGIEINNLSFEEDNI